MAIIDSTNFMTSSKILARAIWYKYERSLFLELDVPMHSYRNPILKDKFG